MPNKGVCRTALATPGLLNITNSFLELSVNSMDPIHSAGRFCVESVWDFLAPLAKRPWWEYDDKVRIKEMNELRAQMQYISLKISKT